MNAMISPCSLTSELNILGPPPEDPLLSIQIAY
jgi:hypothetical protein